MPEGTVKTAEVRQLDPADYAHDEVYTRVDQIVDPSHSFLDIEKSHCCALSQLFCYYTLEYMHARMTVYFSA